MRTAEVFEDRGAVGKSEALWREHLASRTPRGVAEEMASEPISAAAGEEILPLRKW
jgi:hypothetical protein